MQRKMHTLTLISPAISIDEHDKLTERDLDNAILYGRKPLNLVQTRPIAIFHWVWL
jgi:hypothetical protein